MRDASENRFGPGFTSRDRQMSREKDAYPEQDAAQEADSPLILIFSHNLRAAVRPCAARP